MAASDVQHCTEQSELSSVSMSMYRMMLNSSHRVESNSLTHTHKHIRSIISQSNRLFDVSVKHHYLVEFENRNADE